MIVGNKGGSSASNGPDATLTAAASATSTSSASTVKTSATPTTKASASPTAAGPAGTAQIEFDGMQLDAEKASGASARTFTFTSDGAGDVTVNVTKASAQSTRLCLKVGTNKPACKVGLKPNFLTAKADGPHDTWTVTAIGYGTTKPVIDIVFTWPSAAPTMTLSHGRLQGAKAADSLNGFTAVFQPTKAGVLNVQASWTVITADIDITLLDNTTPPAVTVDDRLFKGVTYINPAYTYNVDPSKTYQVKLRNKSEDSGKPDLTTQIAFP